VYIIVFDDININLREILSDYHSIQ
jgi:hypothetical protein